MNDCKHFEVEGTKCHAKPEHWHLLCKDCKAIITPCKCGSGLHEICFDCKDKHPLIEATTANSITVTCTSSGECTSPMIETSTASNGYLITNCQCECHHE